MLAACSVSVVVGSLWRSVLRTLRGGERYALMRAAKYLRSASSACVVLYLRVGQSSTPSIFSMFIFGISSQRTLCTRLLRAAGPPAISLGNELAS